MSHLIEEYSAASGLQIDKPTILETYFPMPFEKYVLIHAGSGMPAKNYDHFAEIVLMIRPTLKQHGYELLQIGAKDDPSITNTIDLRDKTSFHQTAYLIKRASLLIGNDSCNLHFASSFNIPLIGLYGSTSPLISGPYFGNKDRQICLEPDRQNRKPSFAREETPKTINEIKPEVVAKAVFNLLKIDNETTRETIFIGNQYNHFILEVLMDSVIKPDFFQGSILNARMDYLFDEDVLARNLSIRPFCILTEKPIKIEILKKFRANVTMVIYNIDENFSLDFVKQMVESGIPYQITSFLTDDKLNKAKLALFDYGVIIPRQRINKNSIENISKATKYKTNKFLLSNNQIFINKLDWINKKPIRDFSDNIGTPQLDSEEFLENKDWMYFYAE